MAQFKFDLEGILRQRKNIEHMAQRKVAEAQLIWTDLQSQMDRLHASVKEVSDDVRKNHLVGEIDVQFIAAHRRFLHGMERTTLDLARKIADAQTKVSKAQAILLDAAKQRKAMEKLKEKHQERWQADQNRQENNLNDEAGMQIAFMNLKDELDNAADQP